MEEQLNFTVDSALLRELGEKLVETPHLALVELIKNAYDADSTVISVKFAINEKGENEIHLVDNGVGMNFEEVKKYWMRIATTNKAENIRSRKFGRFKTGAKGIGRFCCRRLGATLKLITTGAEKTNGDPEWQKTEVFFDWNAFEVGTDVSEIKCPGQQTVSDNGCTGTTLIIGKLTDKFDGRGYNWLKRQLAVLAANRGVRRTGYQDDPGFNILLEAQELEGGVDIKDFRDELLNGGWGTLTARINKEQKAVCELDALGIGKTQIISKRKFENLRDINLKVGILVEHREQIRDRSILSKGTLRHILQEWGGVQVRYQGFRVFPYGDDDWLSIDYDRGLRKRMPGAEELTKFARSLKGTTPERALLSLLSMRSYVGNVEIGPKAQNFDMKANREGFLQSDAVGELKEFVRYAIDWSTILRDYFLRVEALKKAETARERFKETTGKKAEPENVVKEAAHYIKKEISHVISTLPPPERKKVESSLDTALDVIVTSDKTTKDELAHFRLIASVSTLLLIFAHEVKSLLGQLDWAQDTLALIEDPSTEQSKQRIQETRTALNDLKLRFKELLELISLIATGSKEKPKQFALKERIVRSINIFQLVLKGYNISVDCELVPRNIIVKSMLEAELYAMIINILSNSIKSVIAAGRQRHIEISAERIDGKTLLKVRDTGLKLLPEHYDAVFTPFISDPSGQLYSRLETMLNPEDKYIVGTGTGLGLSIVKEMLKPRGGKIAFTSPPEGWSNQLEITLI